MGGLAFAAQGLKTPRMPPAVYTWVRNECHKKLSELYLCVATPIEGPAKKDYGDIDFLVALEKRAFFPKSDGDLAIPQPRFGRDALAQIGQQLGAAHINHNPGFRSANFALPWPEHLLPEDKDAVGGIPLYSGEDCPPPLYLQVDIQIDSTANELMWHLFKHAHGDIWHLIGVMIRPLGLTVDEEALWLRIPEIEQVNKKLAKIKLSSEPVHVLSFLGFSGHDYSDKDMDLPSLDKDANQPDVDDSMPGDGRTATGVSVSADEDGTHFCSTWTQPFATVEDFFMYLTTCRWFFQVQPPPARGGSGEDVTALRANDRRRMHSRPLFAKWVNEFIPHLQAEGRFDDARPVDLVRDAVREEAFARFIGVREEYNDRLHQWSVQRRRDHIWREVIKPTVPSDLDVHRRGVVVNALKKIILEDDAGFGITPEEPLRDEYGLFDIDRTKRWVEDHWVAVLGAAWELNHGRCAEAMAKKGLKRSREASSRLDEEGAMGNFKEGKSVQG